MANISLSLAFCFLPRRALLETGMGSNLAALMSAIVRCQHPAGFAGAGLAAREKSQPDMRSMVPLVVSLLPGGCCGGWIDDRHGKSYRLAIRASYPVTNDTGLPLLPQPSGPSGSVTVFRSLTKFKAKARASLSKRIGVKRVRPVRIAYLEEENDMKHLIVEWQRLSGFESIACRVLILVTGAA